jgi:invasion protein IalB
MHRIALRCSVVTLVCLVTTSAIAEEAGSPGLTYAPWMKFCLDDTCFVGRDGRSDCGPVVGATLVERRGDTKKTLRVTLPNRVNRERGLRIIIDDGQAIERPYASCFANGCMADHDAAAELVDQLKQGRMLVLEATDKANSPIRLTLPLGGFAEAYHGPGAAPKVYEEVGTAAQIQASLDQARRAEDAHKERCETK